MQLETLSAVKFQESVNAVHPQQQMKSRLQIALALLWKSEFGERGV